MPTSTAALTGLLPLAGAVALVVRGVARARTRRDRTPGAPPPQPKEIAPSDPSPRRLHRTLPDAACEGCSTSIPGSDRLCPTCAHQRAGARPRTWTTALHWLVFLAMMAAIFGAGALLAS
jgi:hypothetical protein